VQIQYPGYTQPVRLPTPSIDQFGWRGWHPDQVRQGSRGRPTNGQMLTADQTTGANVFAVENWVVIGATKDIGHAYVPANPQQFINRRDYRGRGGGYLNAPWFTTGSTLESFPFSRPISVIGTRELPNKYLLRTRQPGFPFWWSDLSAPQAAVSTDWLIEWPASTPTRAKRSISLLTTDVEPPAPTTFPPTLEWSSETPDSPYQFIRRRLLNADIPWTFRPEDLAAMAQWSVEYPDTTRRNALKTALLPFTSRPEPVIEPFSTQIYWTYPDTTRRAVWRDALRPSVFRPEALESYRPTLLWSAKYPDTTRQARLSVAELPSIFRPTEAQENFTRTLLWNAFYPDTTRRRALQAAQFGHVGMGVDSSNIITLLWNAFYPDRTSRLALSTAELPTTFRPEDLQDFAATLLWSALYPDTTRRNTLSIARFPMIQFLPLLHGIIGEIIQRRPTTDPGSVGSRSATSRMVGL
jgi:hypothetical protein